MPPHILVAEDQADIRDLLVMNLRGAGYEVAAVADGAAALASQAEQRSDLLILDLMMPALDGLEVCKALRARGRATPILMLTAKSTELDRVLGLELGADDYLTKPFSVLELQARVKALLRRSSVTAARSAEAATHKPGAIAAGALRIDRVQRRAWLAGAEIVLTPREFDLLWHFVQHPGRVFTRSELLADVWGYGHDGYDHTVNSHINRLRTKLGDERAESGFIHTVWGVGYRFEVAP